MSSTEEIRVGAERLQCRTQQCRYPVVLVCKNPRHNQGLCKKCTLQVMKKFEI